MPLCTCLLLPEGPRVHPSHYHSSNRSNSSLSSGEGKWGVELMLLASNWNLTECTFSSDLWSKHLPALSLPILAKLFAEMTGQVWSTSLPGSAALLKPTRSDLLSSTGATSGSSPFFLFFLGGGDLHAQKTFFSSGSTWSYYNPFFSHVGIIPEISFSEVSALFHLCMHAIIWHWPKRTDVALTLFISFFLSFHKYFSCKS